MFAHNHAWDTNLNNGAGEYHQTASPYLIGTDGKSRYDGGGWNIKGGDGGWYHCADLRLIFDGRDFVLGWVDENGVYLSKLTVTNGQGDWTGHRQIANHNSAGGRFVSQWTGNAQYTRFGSIVKAADGYLVTFTHGAGWIWQGATGGQASNDDIYLVKVPLDFSTQNWQAGQMPSDFGRRVIAKSAGDTLKRPRTVALPGGKFVVAWERWSNDGKYLSTAALVMDAAGRELNRKDLGDARIQQCNDAFLLPRSGLMGWVSGDATNRCLILHTLDENLNLRSYGLTLP